VREGGAPEEVPEYEVSPGEIHLPAVLGDTFGNSRSYWRRVIAQGGVRIDGEVTTALDVDAAWASGRVLHAGKRNHLRLRLRP
jgi:tyrosyl-tRNA synthetase